MKSLRTLAALAALALAGTAQAAVTSYNDKATFLAATGATSLTGPLPDLGLLPVTTWSVPGMTLSIVAPAFQLYIGTNNVGGVTDNDWSTRLPGPDIAISGAEDLDVALTTPAGAFGFDFVEPHNDPNVNAPFVDSLFSVTLFNGVSTVGSFTFNAPDDVASFVGVTSTSAFNRVQIRELTALSGGENEFYGQFYAAPLAAVPEPETYALMLGGLGLFGVVTRRQHKSVCRFKPGT